MVPNETCITSPIFFRFLKAKWGSARSNVSPPEAKCATPSVHGGPYPSTSDGRSPSVVSYAIFRFRRLLSYRGFFDSARLEELKDANSLRIWHLVNGEMVRG